MSAMQNIEPEKKFRWAMREHGKELQRYLMRRLHNAQTARDLAQEVYMRFLRVGNKEAVRDYRAYLFRIAAHVVYEFKYNMETEPVVYNTDTMLEAAEDMPDPDQEDADEHLSTERQLERAFAQLPPTLRAVFLMEVRDGMSHTEVAAKLGLTVNSVKKYMIKAVAALKAAATGIQDRT